MTTIAVSTPMPTIVCPSWCVIAYASHLEDLRLWDGFVIYGSDLDQRAPHAQCAYPGGTPDPDHNPPLVHVDGRLSDGLTLDDAEKLAREILAAVAEARA